MNGQITFPVKSSDNTKKFLTPFAVLNKNGMKTKLLRETSTKASAGTYKIERKDYRYIELEKKR